MEHLYLTVIICSVMVFTAGFSIGRSLFILRLRKEENRKRELELQMVREKQKLLEDKSRLSKALNSIMFRTKIRDEIDRLTK
ncbi:MAG: hypothetical protein ACOCSE_01505 [Chitinivibrionales bacterium]